MCILLLISLFAFSSCTSQMFVRKKYVELYLYNNHDKWGLINFEEHWVLPNEYDEISYCDGYENVSKDGYSGVIKLKGKKTIIPFEYHSIDIFNKDGLTLYSKTDNESGKEYFGYFNKKGKVIWKQNMLSGNVQN